MKSELQILLSTLRRLEKALASTPAPPKWRTWEVEPFETQRDHGPEYRPREWFGELDEAARVRFLRAIRDAERQGLVTTHAHRGRRLSHIRLTKLGSEAVKALGRTR